MTPCKALRRALTARASDRDAGVAMVVTLMVIAVLTGLAATAAGLGISNMQNAGRDRQGTGAQNISEAGIAQGVAYVRGGGVPSLTCTVLEDYSVAVNTAANGCGNSTNPWSNPLTPQHVDAGSGQFYDVWIGVISPFNPPVTRSGTYRIYSTGTSGTGPGQRSVFQDIQIAPLSFPVGIFAANGVNLGGSGGIFSESLYSTGCINSRGRITFSGTDSYYGVPTAAHSTSMVTESNIACSALSSVHALSPCSVLYPYDQDAYGGSLTATTCALSPGQAYTSSKFDLNMLKATYGYSARGLTATQYATLKGVALSQHHYYDASSPDPGFFWPCWTTAATCPNGKAPELKPTIYIKDPGTTNPPTNFTGYQWVQNSACTAVQSSVVLIVESGALTLNGGAITTGNIFAPDGNLQLNGGASVYGSIFTQNLTQTGGGTISLPPCFVQQFNPSIQEVTPVRYHEDDR
jgi:type II secretory pathway pseudopilin PulG